MDLINRAIVCDCNAVEDILKKGFSANTQTSDGTTALQIASANNNVTLVQMLIKYGANVDLPNNCGWTPLMLAAYNKNYSIVELLLANKCNVKAQNKLGLTALTAAACGGNLQILTLLLKSVRNSLDQLEMRNSVEISLLRAAVLYEREECVRYMLNNKIEANYSSPITKTTALMLASSVGNHEITKLLIDYGADPNLVNVCHQTANEICSILGHTELKAYLAERTLAPISYTAQSEAQVFESIAKDDIDTVKSMIKSNCNLINMNYNKDGLNPLTQSVVSGNKNMVLCLIQHGADINIKDKANGYTPLMHAVCQKKSDMVKLLLECGASPDIQGGGGCTALDLAWVSDGGKEIADLIVASSKKNRGRLTVANIGETLSPKSPISRTRNSFRNSLRHDSFKGIVGSISQKFLKNRKSSGSGSQFSPTTAFMDEDDVFPEVLLPGNVSNSLSNGLKLSAFEWPTMESVKGIQEWKKPVEGPVMHSLPALANTIPGEYRPSLKECVFANQNKHSLEGFIPHKIIAKLNNPKLTSDTRKFDNSFSKSDPSITLPNLASSMNFHSTDKESQTKSSSTNISSVEDMLRQLSLEKYTKVFQENEIDLQAFKALTEADLEEMGILDKAHCRKLLHLVLNI